MEVKIWQSASLLAPQFLRVDWRTCNCRFRAKSLMMSLEPRHGPSWGGGEVVVVAGTWEACGLYLRELFTAGQGTFSLFCGACGHIYAEWSLTVWQINVPS